MKIMITGANGLLGQKLVTLILGQNEHELIATAKGENRLPFPEKNYTFQSMDVTDPDQVSKVMEAHRPEAVIHTAAMTNVDRCEIEKERCWNLNADAVRYLVDACSAVNSFLIHLSTDFIFDGRAGPYSEEAEANPVNYYGKSKWESERHIMASDIDWAIVRTILVYGITPDMSRSNLILWVKKSLEQGKQIQVVDDQWRNPTLAEDLAKGCLAIAEKRARGIFNIGGKDMLTPYEMALKTVEFFQLDASTLQRANASGFQQAAKRPPKTGLLIGKAENTLDYSPNSFEEGIALLAGQMAEIVK